MADGPGPGPVSSDGMGAGPWSDGPAMLPRITAPRTVRQQPPEFEQPRATARTPPGRPEPAAFTYSSIRGLPMRFLRSASLLGICLASPLLALGASAQGAPQPPPRDGGQARRQGHHRAGRIHRPLRGGRAGRDPRARLGIPRQGPFPRRHARQGRATSSSPSIRGPTRHVRRRRSRRSRRRRSRLEFAQSDLDRRRAAAHRPATSPTSCSTSAGRAS